MAPTNFQALNASRRIMTSAHRPMARALSLTVLLISALPLSTAHAQTMNEQIVGYVRDATTNRHLYTEIHQLTLGRDGAVRTGNTVYIDAQGQEMARKTTDYRKHRTVPQYRMEMPALGYAEGIREVGTTVVMFKDAGQDRQEEEERLKLPDGDVAADAGFNQLIMDAWPRLQRGQTIRFRLITAGRLTDYAFRARHDGDLMYEQQAATRVRVEPDSMLRLLTEPIELIYDRSGRRLLHYLGVSNVLDPSTGEVYKRIDISYSVSGPQRAAATSTSPP